MSVILCCSHLRKRLYHGGITSAASWAHSFLDVRENSRRWSSNWKTICQDKEDIVEYNPSKPENKVSIVAKATGKCVCWVTAV